MFRNRNFKTSLFDTHTSAHAKQIPLVNTLLHLATYDVQDAEISEGTLTNSICITCVFAQGTSSQGCYISLLENHDSMALNNSSLRIEREGDSLNATGCVENLEGGLYHVAVYDIEADGTVDWHNRALFLTAALNMTSSPEQLGILVRVS